MSLSITPSTHINQDLQPHINSVYLFCVLCVHLLWAP